MSSKLKAGLFFGSSMAIYFVISNLWGEELTTKKLVVTISGALIGGTLGGLLFSFMMHKFSNSNFVKQSTAIELEPNEKMVFEGDANHIKGIEGVGGHLYLTDKRLVFKSHKVNIQNHILIILSHEILSSEMFRPKLSFMKNGLCIITKNRKEKFVVNEAQSWINHLANEKLKFK